MVFRTSTIRAAARQLTSATRIARAATSQIHGVRAQSSAVMPRGLSWSAYNARFGPTAARHFSTAMDAEAGRRALAKAHDAIERDDIDEAMKQLGVAAHLDVADAQYLLGSLLHQDEGDDTEEDDETSLVADAETNRQRAADADEPQDLRTIRKRARAAYKQYLLGQRSDSDAPATRLARSIVQRATPAELDRAFGVTLTQLLDPATEIRPLSAVAMDEASSVGDVTQAIEWLRRAAAHGHRDAHVYLGNLCLEQEPPLAKHALEWYFRVTPPRLQKDPHPDALFNIGMLLHDGVENAEPPLEANRAASVPFFVQAAEAGDASAQFFMGQLLFHGDEELGIVANAKSGMMLLEKAAEQNHSGALFFLAQLYRSGDAQHKIKPNHHLFLHYLDHAMQAGDEDALFCMADMYFHGSDGFDKDLEQARMFYEASAEAGSADAFCCLGALYYNGEGVARDYEKAFMYYQEAADRHSMEAWKNLADMYYSGRGVPKNRATAQSILKMLKKMEEEEEEH
ncbi:hypothetical protein P43SY_005244 [Pythium insidiosum]|uniref:Uncharacterized protein n=1 Tax=Pythium insidiosum TaxID=114742 RepID=A0AAD5LDK2_PYTIN|nr:hypothetical protein P43SY_005244 [Pythium insidiosum]